MTPLLKLVPTPADDAAPALAPARFDLRVQATRPGVAYESTRITPSDEAIESVCQASAREGLPPEPWAALAIETSRSLHLASRLIGMSARPLAVELDHAAAAPESRRVPAGPGGRLLAYAQSLRAAPQRTVESAPSPFVLPVPYVAIIAWQHAAAESDAKVGEWATSLLTELPTGRVAWEASAAEAGQTVCEWVLSQAASCCSRSSTVAHSAG
jgi:hypothetical protein